MAFIQEWAPSSITSATSKTVTGTATTAGNTLFLDVWVRSGTLIPVVSVNDPNNTWTFVGNVKESASGVHMFVCRNANSISSISASWVDEVGQSSLNIPSMIVLAEYDPIGTLIDISTLVQQAGGLPPTIAAPDGSLVRAMLGNHSGDMSDTYVVVSAGVTPTERAGYAPRQTNSTFLRADGYTTSATNTAIGWDRTAGGTVLPVIFNTAWNPPGPSVPQGAATGTWTFTGTAVGEAELPAPMLYRVETASVTPLWLGIVTATGIDLGA